MAKGVIEKIKCDKCGYENEPQRIFCHECGAKLDRSEYVHEVEDARIREAKDAPKRLNDMRKRIPIFTMRRVMIFGLGPLVAAVLILMFMPMDPGPEMKDDGEKDAALDVASNLSSALDSPGPSTFSVNERVMTAVLGGRLKKVNGYTFWEKTPRGGWAFLEPGVATIVTERDVTTMGVPMWFSVGIRSKDGGAEPDIISVDSLYIGRLKLPGIVAQPLAPYIMGDILKVFKLDGRDTARIKKLKITEGNAEVTLGPEIAQAAPAPVAATAAE